jgi:hypothetical protein
MISGSQRASRSRISVIKSPTRTPQRRAIRPNGFGRVAANPKWHWCVATHGGRGLKAYPRTDVVESCDGLPLPEH